MSSVCRLCLCEQDAQHSLLEKTNFDMLEALTCIQINSNDSSTVCCTTCLCDLSQAFKIQQRILRADEKFQNITGSETCEKNDSSKHEQSQDESIVFVSKKCPICASMIEESALMEHTRTHFACEQYCDLCRKKFNNMKLYRAHWDDQHNKEKNFECTDCKVKFRYRCIYLLHNNLVHEHDAEAATTKMKLEEADDGISHDDNNCSPDPIQTQICKESTEEEEHGCDMCEKKFPTRFQLKAHKTGVHRPKKTCPICNAEVTASNFNKHVENHKTAGPRICELCGSILRSQESLRGHMSSVHSNYNKNCEQCGQNFRYRYSYQLHMKRHKGEKSQVCELCGKAFLTVFYLNCHMRNIHLKLKPHVCSYCQKTFQSKFGLKTHIRQHTNETPFRCEVCGEGFRQNVSLRSHRKSKHNIEELKNCKCDVCGKEFGSDYAVSIHKRLH